MDQPSPRFLIVECINADQFPGQIRHDIPFLAGFLRAHGAAVRWLRFGVSTTNQLTYGRDEVTLADDELQRLLAVVAEHRPTRFLVTHELAPAQWSALCAASGGDPTFVVLETFDRVGLLPGTPFRAEDGLRPAAWRPVYTWEPGNALALLPDKDNIALFLGEMCGYANPLRQNPRYAGLDAPLRDQWSTCAFCGRLRERAAGTPVAWVRRQIEAIAADRGVERAPHSVLFENLAGPAHLDAALKALAATGLAARTALLFGIRTDRLVRLEPALREALLQAQRSGQRLGVYATGIESFVADELLRYNKGTTPLDGLRAARFLRELQRDFPDTFSATGLTLLLFTPWTRLDDLDLNLRLVARLGLAERVGNLFASRLRLHPHLAITALARSEGLLAADEPDPVLRLNRRKLFAKELPWRFADPRLTPLCRVYVRLDQATDDDDDPLSVRVRATARDALGRPGHDWMARKLDLLIACADEAAASADVLGEDELLARGAARVARRLTRAPLDATGPNGWALVFERAATPGEVDPRLGLRFTTRPEAETDASLRASAWVFCLDALDTAPALRLSIAADDGAGLTYDPAAIDGTGAFADLLRQGRTLVVRLGQLQVWGHDRRLGACSALSREGAGAACGENGRSAQPVENTTDRLPGCLPGGGPPDPQTEPDSAMRYGLLGWRSASHGLWWWRRCPDADAWAELARGVVVADELRALGPSPEAPSPAERAAAPTGLRVIFAPRRGRAPALTFTLTPAATGQPAYRHLGALALSHGPCEPDDAFRRLAGLVEAAARRTPPPLTDPTAWLQRVTRLLEALGLVRAYQVTVTPI